MEGEESSGRASPLKRFADVGHHVSGFLRLMTEEFHGQKPMTGLEAVLNVLGGSCLVVIEDGEYRQLAVLEGLVLFFVSVEPGLHITVCQSFCIVQRNGTPDVPENCSLERRGLVLL